MRRYDQGARLRSDGSMRWPTSTFGRRLMHTGESYERAQDDADSAGAFCPVKDKRRLRDWTVPNGLDRPSERLATGLPLRDLLSEQSRAMCPRTALASTAELAEWSPNSALHGLAGGSALQTNEHGPRMSFSKPGSNIRSSADVPSTEYHVRP